MISHEKSPPKHSTPKIPRLTPRVQSASRSRPSPFIDVLRANNAALEKTFENVESCGKKSENVSKIPTPIKKVCSRALFRESNGQLEEIPEESAGDAAMDLSRSIR